MPDALPVALEAEGLEERLALLALELLLGAVDPDRVDAERVCGEHEVAHHERAVVNAREGGLVRQDDQDGGRSVERVEPGRPAADGAVLLGKPVAKGLVGDDDDLRGLLAHAARGPEAGFGDLLDPFARNGVGFELAAAAPRLHGFNDGIAHGRGFLFVAGQSTRSAVRPQSLANCPRTE